MPPIYHIPALLQPTIDGLDIKPEGNYVDATFGGGGHSREIIKHLNAKGHLYAFDQDQDAIVNALNDKRFTFIHANFRYIKNLMMYYGVEELDGIIADLGVSFHHFDTEQRGFSFRFDGPLDMRMNQNATIKASDIVNNYTEEQLTNIFRLYGEMNNARQIAKRIVSTRQNQPITTIEQLNNTIAPLCSKDKEKKDYARIYQALRIETNDELGALRQLLDASLQLLRQGGRIAVLTYHSLEDRLVKNFFRSGNFEGKIEKDFYGNPMTPFEVINKKVIVADEQEIDSNPRARSAKLRIAQKK